MQRMAVVLCLYSVTGTVVVAVTSSVLGTGEPGAARGCFLSSPAASVSTYLLIYTVHKIQTGIQCRPFIPPVLFKPHKRRPLNI